jgi:hypothetical protein
LKNNEKFPIICYLMKIVNTIRYCQLAIMQSFDLDKGKQEVKGGMLRNNSIFYLSGVIFEAYKSRNRLYQNFNSWKSYEKGFKNLFEDNNLNNFVNKAISKLRNKSFFHYDFETLKKAVNNYSEEKISTFSSESGIKIDSYYSWIDVLSLYPAIDFKKSNSKQEEDLRELVKKVRDISIKFADAADEIILEYIKNNDITFTEEEN